MRACGYVWPAVPSVLSLLQTSKPTDLVLDSSILKRARACAMPTTAQERAVIQKWTCPRTLPSDPKSRLGFHHAQKKYTELHDGWASFRMCIILSCSCFQIMERK